jgi:hypothetical protein
MPITLEIAPELETRLEAVARTKGLTLEGYLHTLLEVLAAPDAPGSKSFAAKLQHVIVRRKAPALRTVADDAVRRMKADLLAHKERAVEALTKANLLRKIVERHQALIAEKELQALTLARDGRQEQALRRFQESCVYGQNTGNDDGSI